MTHQLDTDDYFIHCIQRFCAEARLNFFLIDPVWVGVFYDYLKQGKIWARALLNMHSEHHEPQDIFHQLIKLAAQMNTQVIDPPDRASAAFNKAQLHPRLLEAGIPVPWTLIVPREQPEDWKLSEAERAALGTPFVIKPAMGYGRKGLVMDASGESDLRRSAALWPDGHYLFQRRIAPRLRQGAPVYFRVYFVFGRVWLSWWNCYHDNYRLVTEAEKVELGLGELEDIVRRIAALTGMTFFSSEIAQTDQDGFVVIDYVNDQCHLLSQSAHPQLGVPDELVGAIAQRLVEAVSSTLRAPASATR